MLKNNIYNIFTMLSIIIFIIFLSYYVTIIIGKKSNNYFKNKNTKVLEKTILTPGTSIIIIQVIDRIYILLVQNKNVTTIDRLNLEEWNNGKTSEDKEEDIKPFDFIKDSYDRIFKDGKRF